MHRARLLVAAALFVGAAPLGAQVASGAGGLPTPAADTGTTAEGWEAGRRSAGQSPVVGRAAAGFLGGVPIGFFGLVVLAGRTPMPALGVGSGLAVIGTAASAGSAAPPKRLAVGDRGAAYERAFAEGYAERLRTRRRVAALAGGGAGVAAGLGLLFALLAQDTS